MSRLAERVGFGLSRFVENRQLMKNKHLFNWLDMAELGEY